MHQRPAYGVLAAGLLDPAREREQERTHEDDGRGSADDAIWIPPDLVEALGVVVIRENVRERVVRYRSSSLCRMQPSPPSCIGR
jgi:hypothetical protein